MVTEEPSTPIEVFISYSRRDEALRRVLDDHLTLLQRQGVISTWHDRRIGVGTEWAGQIDEHLNTARAILLLVSAAFLASDYCYDKEMGRALERHEAGAAWVIPIILRPVDWKDAPFAKLQVLPRDGRPVTTWTNRDAAWRDVARGIREAVEALGAGTAQPLDNSSRGGTEMASPPAVTSPQRPPQPAAKTELRARQRARPRRCGAEFSKPQPSIVHDPNV